jgi:hypothetical protein
MPSLWSTLKIELIADGEQTGTWGQTTNNNLGGTTTGSRGLEQAVVGMATLVTGDFTANSYTLPYTDTNDKQNFRALVLNVTATLSAAGQVIVPSIEKPYVVMNNSSGGFALTVKNSAGTGITVPAGKSMWVYNNGTNVVDVVNHLTSLTLGTALPITSGGTGTTSTTFVNLTTNVTGTLPVANGGTGQTSYTNGQLLIGNTTGNTLTKATLTAGTGVTITNGAGSISIAANNNGTVTSVATGTGLTGGPITSTGTVSVATNGITDALLRQSAGLSLIGRSTSTTGNVADITAGTDNQVLRRSGTAIGFGAVNLASTNAVTGILPVGNGGTGGSTQSAARTGLGATTVGSNLFTLTNPGAIRFLRINADNSVSALTNTDFRTAIGAGTGNGTVTSVGGTGTVNGITLTGTVTSSGNLTLGGTLSGVSLTTQVSGILPVANGGTNNAFFTVSGPATTAKTYTFANENMTIVGTTQTQTLTSKRVTPRIDTIASAATITPTGDISDQYTVTALATGATIAAPSGTPTDGQKLVLRIKDNGTARALTWTTTSGAYRAVGVNLPATTVISKVVYVGCIYNSQDSFWDVIAVAQQA